MNGAKKKTKRVNEKRPSLKGEWGNVGAPPKKTKWPAGPFTMERLFALNSKGPNKQCELSLWTKVKKALINPPNKPANQSGTIYQLTDKKQPRGAVGRPQSRFVLKSKYDSRMMLRPVIVRVNPADIVSVPATSAPPVQMPQNFRPPPVLVAGVAGVAGVTGDGQ